MQDECFHLHPELRGASSKVIVEPQKGSASVAQRVHEGQGGNQEENPDAKTPNQSAMASKLAKLRQ